MSTEKMPLIITLKFTKVTFPTFWSSDLKKTYNRKGPIIHKEPKSEGLHTVIIQFKNKSNLLLSDKLEEMRKACGAKHID